MNDERRENIVRLIARVEHCKAILVEHRESLSRAIQEELLNPALSSSVSTIYETSIVSLDEQIDSDVDQLDLLSDNDKLVELMGEEAHDVFKMDNPELRGSTDVCQGIAGNLTAHVECLTNYLLPSANPQILPHGHHYGRNVDQYSARYKHWLGDGVSVWLALVVEVNALYWWSITDE